jgi:hypothetical protein
MVGFCKSSSRNHFYCMQAALFCTIFCRHCSDACCMQFQATKLFRKASLLLLHPIRPICIHLHHKLLTSQWGHEKYVNLIRQPGSTSAVPNKDKVLDCLRNLIRYADSFPRRDNEVVSVTKMEQHQNSQNCLSPMCAQLLLSSRLLVWNKSRRALTYIKPILLLLFLFRFTEIQTSSTQCYQIAVAGYLSK